MCMQSKSALWKWLGRVWRPKRVALGRRTQPFKNCSKSQRGDTVENIHIRLKVKGKTPKVEQFFQLMRGLDWDFPVGTGKVPGYISKRYYQCGTCGGMVWDKPLIKEDQIVLAGKQCGVLVKVKAFRPESKCKEASDGQNICAG